MAESGVDAQKRHLSVKETICCVTGGMKVKADWDESFLCAAMLAARDMAQRCKELGTTALHIKLGPQEEIGPRPLDGGPSQLSEPLPAREWRADGLRMSLPPLRQHQQEGASRGHPLWTGILKFLFSVNKLPLCQLKKIKSELLTFSPSFS